MTKLEIACVICGIIGILSPARIKVEQPVNIADIFVSITFLSKYIICGLMILLPLFRLWRK